MHFLIPAAVVLLLSGCAGMTTDYSDAVQRRIQLACSTYLVANVALIPFEQSIGAEGMEYVNAARRVLDPACDVPPSNNMETARVVEDAVRHILLVKNRVAGA